MDKLITIYHGSKQIVEEPVFGEGKKYLKPDKKFIMRVLIPRKN